MMVYRLICSNFALLNDYNFYIKTTIYYQFCNCKVSRSPECEEMFRNDNKNTESFVTDDMDLLINWDLPM